MGVELIIQSVSQLTKMSNVRQSTSGQIREMDAQFSSDAAALRSAIHDLKLRAGETTTTVTSTSEPIVTQVHDCASTGKLANRAKDLRGLTEKRFAEVIDGWRRQNESLKTELEMYQNQQRIGQERVQKRNTEIKSLRSENEKLSSLLRKCEERINQLFDVKEREQAEKQRANKLADQLFEHKKMIGELQEQLKEAETLLNKTKTELRRQVIDAEQDTQQARVELEMIEDMVSSIDNQKEKRATRTSTTNEIIMPRVAPSANTALNILTSHHNEHLSGLHEELSTIRGREQLPLHCKFGHLQLKNQPALVQVEQLFLTQYLLFRLKLRLINIKCQYPYDYKIKVI